MTSQVLYFKAVRRGWARNYYYGDAVLYALATAVIFHVVSVCVSADNHVTYSQAA